MSQLSADQQRFLLEHYGRQGCAMALAGGDWQAELRRGSYGGAGAGYVFQTGVRGIEYRLTGQERRMITWQQINAHRDALPGSLSDELAELLAKNSRNAREHWDKCQAIAPDGYTRASSETATALDAEGRRYRALDAALWTKIVRLVAELLPLGDREPADLIEWAAVTG